MNMISLGVLDSLYMVFVLVPIKVEKNELRRI